MPAKQPLYEACKTCQGTRLAPPDHAIHESLPDQSPKVRRRHRAGRVPCPGCSGIGYVLSEITRELVVDQAKEFDAALRVLKTFVDLCNGSYLEDGPSYLSDGALLDICMRSEAILARDLKVPPKTTARRAV